MISVSWFKKEVELTALKAVNDQIEVFMELEDGPLYYNYSSIESITRDKSDYSKAICLLYNRIMISIIGYRYSFEKFMLLSF